jgi:tetratricopeptide (TPR) repeat protein
VVKKPSVAEQFPFPGKPAKPPNPPDSPAPKTAPSDAAAEHPFPAQPPPKLPGDDSSSSSSSSGTDDPDNSGDIGPPLKDEGTEGTSTRRRLPKVQKVQSDDERVDEDLNVAKLYMNDENYPGAYLRAKDAVKTQPDYAATHFALALAAQKMKKKDEAVAEFQAYLKLDPDGEKAKAARMALEELK